MNNKFEVTFLGTNGSCAYNNGKRAKYGTNTLCMAVKAGDKTMIFDAGTGISGFTDLNDYQNDQLYIFLSHYHVDHIGGLLFFPPLFNPNMKIDLYGNGIESNGLYNAVNNFLSSPLHPVGIESFKAKCNYHTLISQHLLILADKLTVRTFALSHPGGSIGYRVDYNGKSLCYCTDVELSMHKGDANLIEFMKDTDLLIIDTFFENKQVIPHWGHSNLEECIEWAKLVNTKKLALYHYGFNLTDIDIDALEKKAKLSFPNTFATADYMKVEI